MKKNVTRSNQILTIAPYYHTGTWVFDDAAVGLEQEPFIAGIPAMIDELVAEIPEARNGFRLLFSADPFPGYQRCLHRLHEEAGGNWYRLESGEEGWLCPALFKYFEEAPAEIYAKAEPLPQANDR